MLISIESHKPHSIWGFLIAWATRSVWCHTAIIVGKDRYEALVGPGFVKRPWKYRKGTYETVLDLPEPIAARFVECLEKMIGMKYPNVGWLALAYALPLFRDMKRRAYCSQAAIMALKYAGLYSGEHDARFNSKPSPGVLYFVAETLAARPDLRKLGS
jgi:hypothetical protein